MWDGEGDADWRDGLKLAGIFLVLSVFWGLFYSLLAPIFTTVQWAAGALGWSDTSASWLTLLLENLRTGWSIALFFAVIVLSYSVLLGLVFLAFWTTRTFNKRRLAYFAAQHPSVYADLEENLGSLATNVLVPISERPTQLKYAVGCGGNFQACKHARPLLISHGSVGAAGPKRRRKGQTVFFVQSRAFAVHRG